MYCEAFCSSLKYLEFLDTLSELAPWKKSPKPHKTTITIIPCDWGKLPPLRMSELLVVSGGYGDDMGLRGTNIAVMIVVR